MVDQVMCEKRVKEEGAKLAEEEAAMLRAKDQALTLTLPRSQAQNSRPTLDLAELESSSVSCQAEPHSPLTPLRRSRVFGLCSPLRSPFGRGGGDASEPDNGKSGVKLFWAVVAGAAIAVSTDIRRRRHIKRRDLALDFDWWSAGGPSDYFK